MRETLSNNRFYYLSDGIFYYPLQEQQASIECECQIAEEANKKTGYKDAPKDKEPQPELFPRVFECDIMNYLY